MIRYLPFILPVVYALLLWFMSASRLKSQLDRESTELADPRLQPVLKQLAQALDLPRIKVFVYEIPVINGLAAPDGRVFITRGFLNELNAGKISAEEIASVIAHELGHVALGHSRKRMIDFTGQNALRVALASVLGRLLPGVGVLLSNFLISLVSARLSRNDEYEADAYASALMIKAGYGTAPQRSLFEKLGKMGQSNQPAWLLSHPKPAERIAAITANEAKWGSS